MSQQHALADRYLDALVEVPDETRARKEQEQRLAAAMTGGHHVCIRGFWHIGKTTLLKGVLRAACERSGGAAIFVDLRDPEREDGVPQSAQAVLTRIAAKVQDFLGRVGATELKVDPATPLTILGELAAPLFVGLDELIALQSLGAAEATKLIQTLLATPKNVKVAVVCHRHRDADAFFADAVLTHPQMVAEFCGPISDEELVNLVNTPALALGVSFENESLGVLAELSGNRPWELTTLCALTAKSLGPDFKGTILPSQIDALVTLDALSETEEGQALIDNCLRVLLTAMTLEERTLVELVATGGEGEVPEDAVTSLREAGWLSAGDEGFEILSGLLAGIALAVAQGDISVSVG